MSASEMLSRINCNYECKTIPYVTYSNSILNAVYENFSHVQWFWEYQLEQFNVDLIIE